MERREFFGTSLALGTAGSALLTGCSVSVQHGSNAGSAPQAATGPVRLNANENPLGLSPAARDALLRDLGEANRYPRQARTDLIAALAEKHRLTPAHIQLGTGSTEILQMAVQMTPEGAVIVIAEPTFEDVARYAAASGRRVVSVPIRRADYAHDIERMKAAAGRGPALVFICNPNNPTGTLTPCDEVDAWIREADERVTFLVDEAYFEFADDPGYRSAIPWIGSKPNVVISRTFSKIYGMAGLRLGYAIAQPATSERLRLMACGNNVNELALVAGRAALSDVAFQQQTLESNRAARQQLTAALGELGLHYLPSHTNFVMHSIPLELAQYNERMRAAGFLVGRAFPPMTDHSRVSLGTVGDMRNFVAALRDFRARAWV